MIRRLVAPLAVLAFGTLAATPAAAKPAPAKANLGMPWISVELPANPLDQSTRGAYLLVHTFYHSQITRELVAGRAIGMVDGKRREIELEFDRTSRPGVLALRKAWGNGGSWVLVITVGPQKGSATALVGIGNDGEVHSIKVPTQTGENGGTWPREVTPQDIDGTFRAVADASADRGPSLGLAANALLIPLALGALWRRRRAR